MGAIRGPLLTVEAAPDRQAFGRAVGGARSAGRDGGPTRRNSGAYRAGSSPEVDEAISLNRPFEQFLAQGKEEATRISEGYALLRTILSVPATGR